MIYLLVPHDPTMFIRMFTNFGLVEQVMRSGKEGWCTVLGYATETDECSPLWVWTLGKGGRITRERATQLPSESSLQTQ